MSRVSSRKESYSEEASSEHRPELQTEVSYVENKEPITKSENKVFWKVQAEKDTIFF